ncbi:hypothetical protein ACIA78_32965 [Streptomyces xanthochromogenes]|uniref:hypothetical protein n=1 Tax=Streptomyces xanthochromogenes TaxID=67384 RepID=UPI003798C70F
MSFSRAAALPAAQSRTPTRARSRPSLLLHSQVEEQAGSAGMFGDRQERLSRVFTNVDKNEWHGIDANITLYNGRIDTALVCNISCWEQDDGGDGWREQLREKLIIVSQELMAFVDLMTNIGIVIPQYGDMLDYMTLVAGIAYLIAKFLEWFKNPDDLVQERTLVFDQAALRHLVTDGGYNSTGWVFDGGIEGRYRLQLRWVGNPPPGDAPGDVKVLSPANEQWGAATHLTGATGSEPALAVAGGTLYVAQRGMEDYTWVGKLNGTTWSGYTQVPNHISLTSPALIEHQGKLHIATSGYEGRVWVAHVLQEHQPGPVAVLDNDRRLKLLLKQRAKSLHVQAANYCWFQDPSRALCLKLAGTPNATKPLAGLCDSARCPQATHHPCHLPVWQNTAASNTVFLDNPRFPKAEKARLRPELERAQQIVNEIIAANTRLGEQ